MTAELLIRHGAAGDPTGAAAVDGDQILGRLTASRCHPASSLGG